MQSKPSQGQVALQGVFESCSHHRPSAADNIAAPWPGLLSGGPNAHPADRVGWMLPKRPPMQMYKDDQAAYSMNEIAINWNAPLIFLLASLNVR
jgi:endoglucanase